uniref:Zn(2)-C6 fungal-type domain-containing protein n=1 Tax=Kwoniella pini CBS 10737 TaxID=1296096 RepID=A0A1B9IAC6_9TREE|nr:uncharacterized protein I206_01796 [Kwoniella pini CBS 10737]OCF52506.1 hypothetical protein I206_01796 [Kwoniella pini CBS 10737]
MAPTVKAVNPPSNLPILPGPSQRKQNLACDSCRKRKVRCLRTEKTQICQQCSNKGEECTNLYIDSLAQAKNKKVRKSSHENIANDMDTVQKAKKRLNSNKKRLISSQNLRLTQMDTEDQSRMHDHEDRRRRNSANTVISTYDPGESSRQGSMTMTRNNSMDSLQQASNVALPDPYIVPQDIVQDPMSFSCHATNIPDLSTLTPDVTQRDMIKYLFAPLAIVNLEYGYNDVSSLSMCKDGKSDLWEEQDGKIWYEQPSEIHKSLDEEAIKDLVDDLIDTFFSIVQPRYTMIDSTLFRERFAMGSNHRLGNISHALLAIVLTYGARFSDHPVLQADGEECSLRDGVHMKNRNRSRLVGLMVIRTREIAERSKIFRVASMENTHSCFLLEHLLGQVINLGTKHYQNIYLSAAVKHLITMDLNTSAKWTEIQDNDLRTEALSLLWIVRMSDASRAALYRLKPSLSAEHFDVDPVQHAMLSEGAPMMQPLGGTEHNIIDQATWFKIHHTFCSICYTLAKSLWIPSISARGIPFTILREFIHSSSIWRDKYLSSIGIPTIWPEHWDFLQAITTCTTDCYYHVLWLLIYKAINDFGIKEEKSILEKNDSNKFEIENIKRRIKEEAEHAALRIAALTGVLTENGYLKLDPLIINQPIFLAGEYLASLGKSEYLICVAGLKQYSVIYPSLWDQADLLDQIYSQAKVNIFDQMQTINNENANSLLIGVVNETTTNHPDEGGQLNLNLDLNMGTMNIPPRLDLMSSFEDWTGSLGSIPSVCFLFL